MDRIHLRAPGNWINDPNGFIYYKGMYHVFYQYFPYAPRWGTMHWGHAVSRDLAHWQHMGVALFPTKQADQNGCFSGCAVEKEGRMHLFYTGVRYDEPNPENIHLCLNEAFESSQMAISSDDGIHFDNFCGKRVVIPAMDASAEGDRTHTRDPKVWRGRDAWYMLLGSKTPDSRGQLLIYRSDDLTDWTFAGRAAAREPMGWMWECPDYFEVGGKGVLVVSPMGFLKDGKREESQTVCMRASFDEEACRMTLQETYRYFDYGFDLYAPQSAVDAEGRRVIVAWLRMSQDVDGAWNGMFCMPRVVEATDEHLYFRVHPNVERLYARRIDSPAQACGMSYKLSFDLEDGETVDVGGYRISRCGRRICTDRSKVIAGQTDCRMHFATPQVLEGFHLDVYVDQNIVEVFVNRGEWTISNAVYALTDELKAEKGKRIDIYTLEGKQDEAI